MRTGTRLRARVLASAGPLVSLEEEQLVCGRVKQAVVLKEPKILLSWARAVGSGATAIEIYADTSG